MLSFAIKLVLSAVALFAVASYLPGVELVSVQDALVLLLVLAGLNAVVRPVLGLLALPITVLTLGLFALVLNGAMVLLADHFLAGFAVNGWLNAIIFSVVLSVLNGLVDSLVRRKG
jgi:putative membrane protein